jgi:hypothetical protein
VFGRKKWSGAVFVDLELRGALPNTPLGLLVVTDQESGNRPHPLANIRRTR